MDVLTILWLIFALLGQWSLLILLGTFGVVRSLRQRHNLFLINFLFTTFLSTWPPCLLFFTGQQGNHPPHWLCFTQAILMDGVAPMSTIALSILVFHVGTSFFLVQIIRHQLREQTWTTLKSSLASEKSVTERFSWIKVLLLCLPYIVFVSWCMASLLAALQAPRQLEIGQFVYCANNSLFSNRVRRFVGFFMILVGFFDLCMEVCIGYLFYLHHARVTSVGGDTFRENYCLALRILIFSALQILTVLLSLFNSFPWLNSQQLKEATQLIESMDALGTFVVFATQKDVLGVWGTWRGKPHEMKMLGRRISEPDFVMLV
ncbi:hypothetical protein K439DRAFT_1660098 [Ramaria rubella]|nr:hypothetical protein K439DRAFT_1660098 [Ramaria rubella]